MPSFREIIKEKNFLDVSRRSREVGGGKIIAFDQNENIIHFELIGLTNTYQEYIKVLALDNINTRYYTLAQLIDIITNSNLEIACTCPAYLYWGFQYVDAVDGSGLWIAGISPDIRNPDLKGGGCKHLHRILSQWPTFAIEIASLYPYKTDTITINPIRSRDRMRRMNSMFKRLKTNG